MKRNNVVKIASYSEFIKIYEGKDSPIEKIQILREKGADHSKDNEKMYKLTKDVNDRLFINLVTSDKDVMSKISFNDPMLIYTGLSNNDSDKLVNKIIAENGDIVYNLPSEMRKTSSKVGFHKMFKNDFIPKTVFTKNDTKRLKWPIICKPDKGHSGIGIEKFDTFSELDKSDGEFDLYSECVDFNREYRVLVFKGNPFLVYERILVEDDNKSVVTKNRDEAVSFVYVEQDKDKIPYYDSLKSITKKINEKINLDLYSLDFFIENGSGDVKVIEANSQQGLGSNTLVHIYEMFYKDFYNKSISDNDKNFISDVKRKYSQIIKNDYKSEYNKSEYPKSY